MRIDLVKTRARGVQPATEQDLQALQKVKYGDMLPVHIRRPRNGDHHRKFFALVNLIAENHHRLRTVEDVLVEIKVRVGHFAEHVTEDGEIVYVPRSISYEEMDQVAFATFYERALEAAATHMLPGIEREKLDAYLAEVERFAA